MEKKKAIAKIVIISIFAALLVVFSLVSFTPSNSVKGYAGFAGAITRGLDLDGGIYANYTPQKAEEMTDEEYDEAIGNTSDRIQSLIEEKGYEDARVYVTSDNKIRIESPNTSDAEDILELIGSGEFKIRTTADATAAVILSGENITSAFAMQDPTTYYWGTYIGFNEEGAAALSTATASATSSSSVYLYFYRGDAEDYFFYLPVSSQIAQEFLFISTSNGSMTQEAAIDLAIQVSTGSYKVTLTVDGNAEWLSATAGEESTLGITIAGGVAVLLILLILAIIYRELGLMCGISILIFMGGILFFMQAVPVITLSTTSLGAVLVSLILVTSLHIIMLEKMKVEYALGKKLKTAVKTGYKKSINILVEISSILAIISLIGYFICKGSLQSFCMILMIGSLLAMLITLLFTYHLTKSYTAFNPANAKRVNFNREEEVDEIE